MGYWHYPSAETCDWKKTYATYQEAKDTVKESDGKYKYIESGKTYDWYEIVDLKEWIEQ
jgi:hypothetical protein